MAIDGDWPLSAIRFGTAFTFHASRFTLHFVFAGLAAFCFHRHMSRASLASIVRYCDRTLRTAKVPDYEGAANGLQVENPGTVSRIAAAV